jgi:hypothetical protein
MPQRHTIEVGIVVKDDGSVTVEKFNDQLERTDEELKKAEQAGSKFGKSFDSFVQGAYQRAGQMATEFLSSLPGQIVELGKLGAQAQAAELRFERFAGGAEQAEEFLQAFATATDGTVDKMGAMSSAARLLQMGLVADADEMETVAALATKLGDQTQGATDRIADFSALLANQSIPRLDNFGISSGRVRNRIEELQRATAGMSREEAFKIAVMEEGAKSLDKLGDTSELAQVKIDKVTAAIADAKVGVGELIVELFDGVVNVDEFAARLRALPETIGQVAMLTKAWSDAMAVSKGNIFNTGAALDEFENSLKRQVAAQTDFKVASEEVRFAYTLEQEAIESTSTAMLTYQQTVQNGITPAGDSTLAHNQYAQAIASAQAAQDAAIAAAPTYLETLAAQAEATKAAATEQTNLQQSLMGATDAQIASAAITQLGELMAEDTITAEDYATAVTETQLAFGLADEESIRLSSSILELVGDFGAGEIAATDFDEALQDVIMSASTGQDEVAELALLIDDIPDKKRVDIEVVVTRRGDTATVPILDTGRPADTGLQEGFQTGFNGMVGPGFGGPKRMLVGEGAQPERVMVQPITNNNLTVNTRATQSSVIQDFDLLNSMAA